MPLRHRNRQTGKRRMGSSPGPFFKGFSPSHEWIEMRMSAGPSVLLGVQFPSKKPSQGQEPRLLQAGHLMEAGRVLGIQSIELWRRVVFE